MTIEHINQLLGGAYAAITEEIALDIAGKVTTIVRAAVEAQVTVSMEPLRRDVAEMKSRFETLSLMPSSYLAYSGARSNLVLNLSPDGSPVMES